MTMDLVLLVSLSALRISWVVFQEPLHGFFDRIGSPINFWMGGG